MRAWRAGWAAAAVLLLGVPAGLPGPARADQLTAPEAQAARDAVRAAVRVARLTAEYRRHSTAAASAASELAAAYGRVATAEERAGAAGAEAARARSGRAAATLALYAYGAGAHTGLTLLTAGSPEDGLWRLAVGVPVGERLLSGAARQEQAAGAEAGTGAARARAAEQAAAALSRVLGRLRAEEDAARLTLDAARAELGRLDAAARRERVAREAAAALARAQDDATAAQLASSTPLTALGIPAAFERAYRAAAATCPGLSWTLLAAVGQVESGHGRNNGPSSAGAIGPMQFLPGTFAAYAVDGDGDGVSGAWDPEDAIFTAARYLCASGAGRGAAGVRRALFAYNHAQWYVDLVLRAQAAITARAIPAAAGPAPPGAVGR